MRKQRWSLVAALALVAAVAASIAGAGSAGTNADYKVGLVTDIGSLQDRSFNQLANKGRLALQAGGGFDTRVFETKTAADRLLNLVAAADQGNNLVFGTGFAMFEPLDKVVPRYPNQWFAGIDVGNFLLSKPYPNYIGILFAEQQGGYLAGYLAALQVKREGKGNVIGAVGANGVPPILRYMSGYIQGAKAANPRIKVLINFANDPTFNDQAKCKEQALSQIERGARVVFQIAGGCGLGVVSAAKDKGVWAIGVDADQLYLGPQMLTSAIKKVDTAVTNLAKLLKAYPNTKGGRNIVYTVKSGAVGLGSISPKVNPADVAKVKLIEKRMAQGKVNVVEILKQFK